MTLSIPEKHLFPVMGVALTSQNSLKMDLTANNVPLSKVDLKKTAEFNDFVFSSLKEADKRFGYGGYLENRIIYRRSEHFQQGESRSFHLGMDIWAEAGQPVYCPYNGSVHSFANNDNFGDYGPTIILEHEWNSHIFYTLYGHLSVKSLDHLQEQMIIQAGDKLCEIGPFPENGDWPPHLHFQVMTDLLGKEGDFPGVCGASELEQFKKICLDPTPFVKITPEIY